MPDWQSIIKKNAVTMIDQIRDYFEITGYNVCSRMSKRLHLNPEIVRLYFIYISFVTLGSPIIIYLFLAFWLRFKDYLYQSKRPSVLDL